MAIQVNQFNSNYEDFEGLSGKSNAISTFRSCQKIMNELKNG